MDSVESLNKFFTKLLEEHKKIATNAKKNNELLSQLYTSEQEEEKGRKKTAAKVKRRKDREKRNKKRGKLDTVRMMKETLNKMLGGGDKKSGGGLLKWLLAGGALGALGLKMLDDLRKGVQEKVDNAVKGITGKIEDWGKKLLGIAEEETAGIEDAVPGDVKNVDGQQTSDGKATQPPAQPEASSPSEKPEGKKEEPKKEKKEEEKQEQKGEDTKSITKTTDKTETEEAISKTKETRTGTTTNRETTSTVTVTEDSEPETTSTTSSRRSNRRSSSGKKKGAKSGADAVRQATGTASASKSEEKSSAKASEKVESISGSMMAKAKTIAKRLMSDLNISAAAAAGIVGNLMLESGLKPNNVEDGKGFSDGPINNVPVGTRRVGYGYGQWTNDRLERFRGWLQKRGKADKSATDEDNYQYLLDELRGPEPIRNHWKSGTSIPQNDPVAAADWFMMNWERPGKPHADRRQEYAKQVFSAIRKQQGGAIESGVSSVSGVSKDARSLNSVSNSIGAVAKFQTGGSVKRTTLASNNFSGASGSASTTGSTPKSSKSAIAANNFSGGSGSASTTGSTSESSKSATAANNFSGAIGSVAKYQTGGNVEKKDQGMIGPAFMPWNWGKLVDQQRNAKPEDYKQQKNNPLAGMARRRQALQEAMGATGMRRPASKYQTGGTVTNPASGLNSMVGESKPTKRLQGGGHVGEATEHIKKDEALSSLTPGPYPQGVSDWIREGGTSVISKTNWSEVKDTTKIHTYTDSVGQTTIGWGSTYYDNISNGKKPVKPGDVITKKKADQVLHENVQNLDKKFEKEMGPNWGKMSDSQRAGLLSMGYNAPNFYSSDTFAPTLKASLQRGDMEAAADNLSWGGPSPSRIAESQAMLRKGPMDLNKIKGPKIVGEKKVGQKIVGTGNPIMDKARSFFGGPSVGDVVKKQAGGVINQVGSAGTADTKDQVSKSASSTPSLMQSMGSAAKYQTGGSVKKTPSSSSKLSNAIGSVAPMGGFGQSMGSAAKYQTGGSVKNTPAAANNSSNAIGSAATSGGFGQSMGSVGSSAKFVQSMGSAGSSDKFQQAMGSIASKIGKVAPLALQTGGAVSGPTFVGRGLQSGGIVPGSGSGDQFPIDLPEGSFVLNREAARAVQKLQTGGVASLSTTKHINKLEQRFFAANETFAKKQSKKKRRPVVVVQGGGGSKASVPSVSRPKSPRQIESGSDSLNMNMLRGKMHRVKAGARF